MLTTLEVAKNKCVFQYMSSFYTHDEFWSYLHNLSYITLIFRKYRCLRELIDTGMFFTRMSNELSLCVSEQMISPHATQHTFAKTLYKF